VKSRNGEPTWFVLEQLADALLHLLRGFVSKGDGSDVRRAETAFLDQVGDLLRDHARLAGAGAGQYEQGAIKIADSFALRRIE